MCIFVGAFYSGELLEGIDHDCSECVYIVDPQLMDSHEYLISLILCMLLI